MTGEFRFDLVRFRIFCVSCKASESLSADDVTISDRELFELSLDDSGGAILSALSVVWRELSGDLVVRCKS